MSEFHMISADDLVRRDDYRPLDQDALADLADSIQDLGLLNPLTVRLLESGRYQVIAGSHRFAACGAIGLHEIPCHVVDLDDAHAELAMIDENLRRKEVVGIMLEKQLARRKAIYLELHPQTRAHVAGAHASNAVQGNASAKMAPAFTAETAAITGKSERSIQRGVERGEKITLEAAEVLSGTQLDKGAYREKLKTIAADKQVETVKRDLAAPQPRPTPKPKPEPGEAFTRFIALASDMGKLSPKDIVEGIPVASRRAELMGYVRGLHDLLDAIDAIMEGGSDA